MSKHDIDCVCTTGGRITSLLSLSLRKDLHDSHARLPWSSLTYGLPNQPSAAYLAQPGQEKGSNGQYLVRGVVQIGAMIDGAVCSASA